MSVSFLAFLFSAALSAAVVVSSAHAAPTGPFEGVATAKTVGAKKVRLTWEAGPVDTVGYNIYDASLLNSPRLLMSVRTPLTSVTISSLATAQLFTFRVQAVDVYGKEYPNSKEVSAIPYGGIEAVSVMSGKTAQIMFADAVDADSVQIYCHNANDPTDHLIFQKTDMRQSFAIVEGLTEEIETSCRVNVTVQNVEDNNDKTITFVPHHSP